jgi:hypothetical protein
MKIKINPGKQFKTLLVILAAIALFIAVLLISAFRMLKWAQDNGIIEAPGETIAMDGWNDIDKDTMEMININSQPMSAIESIQLANFQEGN